VACRWTDRQTDRQADCHLNCWVVHDVIYDHSILEWTFIKQNISYWHFLIVNSMYIYYMYFILTVLIVHWMHAAVCLSSIKFITKSQASPALLPTYVTPGANLFIKYSDQTCTHLDIFHIYSTVQHIILLGLCWFPSVWNVQTEDRRT